MKQKAMVLDALEEGADNSIEIADMTGLSIAVVSNYLSDLVKDGVVKETGRYRVGPTGKKTLVRTLITDGE